MEYASEPAMMLLRQAQKHGIRIGGWFAGHYACDYETTFCHIPYFLIDSVRPQPIKSLFPNVRNARSGAWARKQKIYGTRCS